MPVEPVLAPATGSGPILELAGIGVRRGGAWLLAEANLVVMPGERWVVVGPNGAGKSTLLAVAEANLVVMPGELEDGSRARGGRENGFDRHRMILREGGSPAGSRQVAGAPCVAGGRTI